MKARAGVYFTEVDGEAVVLDLHENRYFGLGAASAAIWRGLHRGTSSEELGAQLEALGVPTAHVDAVIARQREIWREGGLVDCSASPTHEPLPSPRPATAAPTAALDEARVAATRVRARDLLAAAFEAVRVHSMIRAAGAPHAIRQTQRLPADRTDDTATLYEVAKACQTLRRPLTQGLPDCVHRSVVLARLLRRRRVDATICIGVRKLPFLAHAWVESGGVVVNDRLADVRSFARMVEF